MYELLLALIVVLFALVKVREHYGLVVWKPNEWYTTDTNTSEGYEIYSLYPDTCPEGKERDGLLCYDKCIPGYKGVGPMCWAESVPNIGVPVGLEPCQHGWVNDGLTCRKPIRCEPVTCAKGWDFFKKGCSGGSCSGGQVVGRLNNGGICDWPSDRGNLPSHLVDKSNPKNYIATHPVKFKGMCYKQCPGDYPYMSGKMLGRCFKPNIDSSEARGLSYTRDAGSVPKAIRLFRSLFFL